MSKIIYAVIIIGCLGLIGYGVYTKTSPQSANSAIGQSEQQVPIPVIQTPSAQLAATATTNTDSVSVVSAIPINTNVTHYRPDSTAGLPTASTTGAPTAPDVAREFNVTIDLIAKLFLIDKYKPGVCFGAPVAIPQVAIDGLIDGNPALAEFLRQHYNLKGDLEVYNKMKQLQNVTLKETSSGSYDFSFMDGQCSNVTYYQGKVVVVNGVASDSGTTQQGHSYN